MRIGDIEYAVRVRLAPGIANTSVLSRIQFALGIKVRPLLTRVQAWNLGASAATGGQLIGLENGNSINTGITLAALRDDTRMLPVWAQDNALATNGMGFAIPFESTWWKILMPEITIHGVSLLAPVLQSIVTLHYRFAELTDDEIVEIAAQRSSD